MMVLGLFFIARAVLRPALGNMAPART
jgi:hypothetical protein